MLRINPKRKFVRISNMLKYCLIFFIIICFFLSNPYYVKIAMFKESETSKEESKDNEEDSDKDSQKENIEIKKQA